MEFEKSKSLLMKSGALFFAIASIAMVLVLIGLVVSKGLFSPNPETRSNVITVTGKGEAYSVPDVATFSFTAYSEGKDLEEAQTGASLKVDKITSSILELGIPEKDIRTTNIYSNPKYEWQASRGGIESSYYVPVEGKQVIVGYEMSQTTEIKVRDLDKASSVLLALGSKEVQSFYGPQFEVDNDESVKDLARQDAIEDAKNKAEKLADSLGVKLGKVLSFSEGGDEGYPVYPMMSADMAYGGVAIKSSAESANISTGENKINATVSITYQIK